MRANSEEPLFDQTGSVVLSAYLKPKPAIKQPRAAPVTPVTYTMCTHLLGETCATAQCCTSNSGAGAQPQRMDSQSLRYFGNPENMQKCKHQTTHQHINSPSGVRMRTLHLRSFSKSEQHNNGKANVTLGA